MNEPKRCWTPGVLLVVIGLGVSVSGSVPKNPESARVPGSRERGTRLGSGFLGTENPGGFPILGTRPLKDTGRRIRAGSPFLGTRNPGGFPVLRNPGTRSDLL